MQEKRWMGKPFSVPKIWKGNTAFVIGGGPTLRLAAGINGDSPHSPEVYRIIGEYLKPMLEDKHVIGVNNSYLLGDWVEVCWFGDLKWWRWHRPKLRTTFSGLVMTCNENTVLEDVPWLKRLHRARRTKSQGLVDIPTEVCWNNCSGNSAINLAVLFGVKRIVLIGFDMKLVGEHKNWHDDHNEKLHDPFARYIRVHQLIKKDADEMGVEILNASPDSALTMYPIVKLEEII